MDYKELQSFVEVVQSKSFSVAAEKLKISQPTISTHIKNLEEELHSKLLIRTARVFEVTPRGKEVYECSKNILKTWDDMVNRWNGKYSKIIRIGASTIPAAYILPELLTKFGEVYADIYFNVSQSDSREILDLVKKDSCDIGLVGMKEEETGLAFEEFYQDKLVLITPVKDKYLKRKERGGLTKEDIVNLPIIMREEGSGSRKNAAHLLENLRITESELQVVARVNDQESIKNLVASGLGVSIISEKAAEDYIAEKRVLAFDLPGNTEGRNLYIAYQKEYIRPEYIEIFKNYVKSYYHS